MVLPNSMRLKGHRCFSYLHKFGRRFYSSSMVIKVVQAKPKLLNNSSKKFLRDSSRCRCAVAISNKVSKKAVIRNRLRRMFHNHLRSRLGESEKLSNTWALISLKPNSSISNPKPLLDECDKLLKSAKLLP